jgi:GNAT superfamily N-acetyltransferase
MASKGTITVGLIEEGSLGVYESLMTEEAAGLLGSDVPAVGLGAEQDGLAVGALVGTLEEENVFHILSLFVTPESRRMGVATELLDRLFDVIEDEEPGIVYTMDFAEDGSGEAEALADFLIDRGFPEADDPVPGEYHFVFFA